MLIKLAYRNVKRSGRDYAIYFITVSLGVAMFYAFNAIEGQAVLFDALSTDSVRMLGLLNMLISLFSGVVACVLGFLVVYANRFLIRRRRREFGTYLLLGMSAGRVSCILLYETAIVGLASLAAGLVLGTTMSQGLSFVTAALMGTTMAKYRFIISRKAMVLTALCFVAIFAISAVVDVFYVRRCKLASLLSTHDANEGGHAARIPVRVAGFACAVALLGCAYWQLSINGMRQADRHFWTATVLMVLGTFLFFWSVAGFIIFTLSHARDIYLRGIRMFTLRQVASKINTAFASMGMVCVMLFLALTTASVGLGLIKLFAGDIEQNTRFDATLISNGMRFPNSSAWETDYEEYKGDIASFLSSHSPRWNKAVRESAQLDYWDTGMTFQELLFDQIRDVDQLVSRDILEAAGVTHVLVIAESQYNATCALIGEQGVHLAEDEFAIDNTLAYTNDVAAVLSGVNIELALGNTTLHGIGTLQHVPLETSAIATTGPTIVVPDAACAEMSSQDRPYYSYLNVMYRSDRLRGDKMLEQALAEALPLEEEAAHPIESTDDVYAQDAWPVSNVYTGRSMADQAGGLRMVIAFLALYIGLVMLVATAAILAIQQLSETADSLGRYRRLSNLGCELREILGSLRTQTVVYFCAPLVLAAAHTACAVKVVSRTIFAELGVNMLGSIGIAASCVMGIYAVYLIATYALSRSIVRSTIY